jgi:mRNA interferase RelE/StbE
LSEYQIFETDEFLKKIKKITNRDQIFIERKILQHIYPQLKEEPHYGNNIKKLMDYKPETWRYRIGKYRLFYVIDENEKTVYILSIDLRKEAY